MKKALTAALLVLGGCLSAEAGEINWTGFHVGLNGGYGWASSGVTALPGDALTQSLSFGQPVVPPVSASLNANGGLGGGQVGYDWQFSGRGVVGVEADIAAASLKTNASTPLTLFGTQPATFDVSRNIDWFGTVRGRVGFLASPDLLIFATGGFAYGRVSESASVSLPLGASNSIGNFAMPSRAVRPMDSGRASPAARPALRPAGPPVSAVKSALPRTSASRSSISTSTSAAAATPSSAASMPARHSRLAFSMPVPVRQSISSGPG
jgi:opacity protein-like surface antigen